MSTKSETGESYTIIYSGQQDIHHRGVTLNMKKLFSSILMAWEPINERIIKARFKFKYCKFTIMQCYTHTNDNDCHLKIAMRLR